MTDFKKIQDLLEELHDEGDHVPERSSIHHQWVDKHFALLQDMIERQKHPLKKITDKLSSEISLSPQTLQKHYQAVKKLKLAEARRAKKQQKEGEQPKPSTSRRRYIDPSTVKPPPPLVHAEVVEE